MNCTIILTGKNIPTHRQTQDTEKRASRSEMKNVLIEVQWIYVTIRATKFYFIRHIIPHHQSLSRMRRRSITKWAGLRCSQRLNVSTLYIVCCIAGASFG